VAFRQNYQGYLFVGFELISNFWFVRLNFGSRSARKPSKGSKDSDDI